MLIAPGPGPTSADVRECRHLFVRDRLSLDVINMHLGSADTYAYLQMPTVYATRRCIVFLKER